MQRFLRPIVFQQYRPFFKFPWSNKYKSSPMGSDKFGNTYYEIIANPTSEHKHKRKVQRLVCPPGVTDVAKVIDCIVEVPQNVPPLWESWLRHRRDSAPTTEELVAEDQRIQGIKMKSRELNEKYIEERKKLVQEGVIEEKGSGPSSHPSAGFPIRDEYER